MRWFLILAAISIGLAGGAQGQVREESKDRRAVVRVVRLESRELPIEVAGPDLVQNRALLDEAKRVWRAAAAVLLPLEDGRTRLRIRWVVKEPKIPPPDVEFPWRLQISGEEKIFVVDVWGQGLESRPLARSVAAVYAQAVAWDGALPEVEQELARPPYWLIEGLAARLVDARKEDWAAVMARLHRTGTLPALSEVQSWEGPGYTAWDEHLRRAVCYWLGRLVARTPVESRTLRLWLQATRTQPGARYWDKAEAEAWWQQSALEKVPAELPVLSWEQTAARLREALHFPARVKGERESCIISLMDLPDSPDVFAEQRPWESAVSRLAQLRIQSHWLWNYVIDRYDAALRAWLGGRLPEYRQRLAEARILEERMNEVMTGSSDLLDWVTVNFPVRVNDPDWVNFRRLVDETERVRPGRGLLPRAGGIE